MAEKKHLLQKVLGRIDQIKLNFKFLKHIININNFINATHNEQILFFDIFGINGNEYTVERGDDFFYFFSDDNPEDGVEIILHEKAIEIKANIKKNTDINFFNGLDKVDKITYE